MALPNYRLCLWAALAAITIFSLRCQGFSISRSANGERQQTRGFLYRRNSGRNDLALRGGSSLEKPDLQPTELDEVDLEREKQQPRIWSRQLGREMFAEAVGTFLVVQLGLGSVMAAIYEEAHVGLFQVASVWAIVVTVAVAVTGPISGAHLNPAISFAFALLRPSNAFGFSKLLPYIGAQLVGAVAGSWISLMMYKENIIKFEAANKITRGTIESIASAKAFGEYFLEPITAKAAFLIETFATATLAFVVFSLTNAKNDTQKNKVFIPPLIGATVASLVAVVAPLTQCGMNPARDFGPRITAFFNGWKGVAFKGWWVYVLGPMIGAPIGGFLADKVLYGGDD